MTITISTTNLWWIFPLILFIIPFIVGALSKDDPWNILPGIVSLVCWGAMIGILIGHYL